MKKLILTVSLCLCLVSSVFGAHFSFAPLKKPVPTVTSHSNPVDNFIASSMKRGGQLIGPEADKPTLINRLYMDLTGLPPSYEQIKAFEADSSPTAYEKLVDELLASERYGEKQARNWMDVARYSDTRGADNRNQEAEYVYAWTYRKWLIESFNEDKSYDEFLREQLAADLMVKKGETQEKNLAALGFLSIGKYSRATNDRIDEKIDTTSKAMIGLTVACARCHDHKFDPIETEDYYGWHGIFASLRDQKAEVLPVIENTSKHPQYRDYMRRQKSFTNDVFRFQMGEYAKWMSHSRTNAVRYMQIAYITQRELDPAAARDYQRTNKIDKVDIMTGIVRKWQREMNGRDQFWEAYKTLSAKKTISTNDLAKLKYKEMADYLKKKRVNTPRKLITVYSEIVEQARQFANRRIKATRKVPEGDDIRNPLYVRPIAALYTPQGPTYLGTKDTFHNSIPNGLRNRYSRDLAKKQAVVIQLEQTHPAAPRRAQMLADSRPVTSRVLIKGNASRRGEMAPKGYIKFFEDGNYTEGTGRYELANSIASSSNPLTPRVIVNRTWQWLFGEGFVDDPDNFGKLSNTPEQKELLDFLAVYLIQNNWSLKSLNKIIVTSRAYKQTSNPNARYELKDPDNRFIHRNPQHRLTFEEMRDAVLMASGELQLSHDGRPIGMFIHPKRSVYARIDRGKVPAELVNFDFANPNMATGKRNKTTVPQQALFWMNGDYIKKRVEALIKQPQIVRAIDEGSKVKALYQRILRRDPLPIEVKLGIKFINEEGVGSYAHALLMSNEFAYVK